MLLSARRTRVRMHWRKKDGAFKTFHDDGELVDAKMGLEVREAIDHPRLMNAGVRANFARHSLHAASTAAMESVMVLSR
jgi:hypothetical protein